MKCQDCVAFVVCKKKTKLLQLDEHTWEEAYRCEGVENMCPYFKHEFDDPMFKTYCSIHAKISEKEEEIIIRTIQEIGGETFHEITIDRNKVLEALTDYQNKIKGGKT